MASGGRRNGAGRPKGAPNMRTRAMFEEAAAGGEMPIAYMLHVMRDEEAPDLRRDAMAKAAAAYLYPRIAALREDTEEDVEATDEAASPQAEDVQPERGSES